MKCKEGLLNLVRKASNAEALPEDVRCFRNERVVLRS